MREYKFLKPKEGLIVRDPVTLAIMPEQGMEVPYFGTQGTYYKRRVQCGDCIIVEKPKRKTKE